MVVLHGGPGAGGYLAPLAEGLSDAFRVLEPLQRGSGEEPLTVATHVADLDELLDERRVEGPPALVGHSWGAMLALAYAAAHPERVSCLVLIGCGTFDQESRDTFRAEVERRMDGDLRRRVERLPAEFPEPDEWLRQLGDLLLPLYSYETETDVLKAEACDARACDETWRDMLRLQESGVYPSAFSTILEPVLMLHGTFDPHPGSLIRATLQPCLPQLECRELERCGHYPWLETHARDEFFFVLREWLARQATHARQPPRR